MDNDSFISLTTKASQLEPNVSHRLFLSELTDLETKLNILKCTVCWKPFEMAECVQYHTESLHDLIVDFSKLEDENEADFPNRVIRSVAVEEELFGSLHLEDFEQRSEIIKVRDLTKKFIEESSRVIQRNMS